MEIQFLGTGAGIPAKHRNVSGIALNLVAEINEVWLFDVGEGSQQQILRTNIRPRKIKKIFLTHLHGDHLFGLPGLLSSRSFQNGEDAPSDLDIYAPKGAKEFVETALRISQTKLNYKLRFHEIQVDEPVLKMKEFTVTALPLEHGITCYGFRIEETAHEGELQVEKLRALNVPSGPIYGKLKRGETVELEDGRVIDGKDFIGSAKAGRIVAIMGDTRKTKNAEILAKNADILIHEATHEAGQEKLARRHFHSTTSEAAEVALNAQAKKLLLTHLSARFMIRDHAKLVSQAKKIFPNSIVVKDFDIVEIPFEK
ncbi:ribonuclease Z [Pilibacter termitis]|uniref:Ribonuclease Z n=1 Tax=Pilibacter termitis TaxID=263852 RepID=A0A1T4K3E0_9ENTE|nr:ribonuclease Z [Pilibacter termitis]SJZ36980.1 ribonuclease Z [Pilibacter termitis]